MERGRTGAASVVAEAYTSCAAAAGLSGVARGSEREGGNTTARRDKRPNNLAAACRDATHRRKICADAGPNPGNFRFRGRVARASRLVQRGRPAPPVREPLTRAAATPNIARSYELTITPTPSPCFS